MDGSKIVIKTTPAFKKKALKLMTKEALEDLYDFLAEDPKAGDIIKGSGGIRKLRWKTGKSNKGKSGGIRVLYHYSKDVLVILITLYAKNTKENISQKEKQELKILMPKLIAKYSEDI